MYDESGSFGLASNWLLGIISGQGATGMAVIAIAALGLAILTGRTNFRRTGRVILGGFLLLGASAVASGMLRSAGTRAFADSTMNDITVSPQSTEALPRAEPSRAPQPFDPYAGS